MTLLYLLFSKAQNHSQALNQIEILFSYSITEARLNKKGGYQMPLILAKLLMVEKYRQLHAWSSLALICIHTEKQVTDV